MVYDTDCRVGHCGRIPDEQLCFTIIPSTSIALPTGAPRSCMFPVPSQSVTMCMLSSIVCTTLLLHPALFPTCRISLPSTQWLQERTQDQANPSITGTSDQQPVIIHSHADREVGKIIHSSYLVQNARCYFKSAAALTWIAGPALTRSLHPSPTSEMGVSRNEYAKRLESRRRRHIDRDV